MRLLEFEATVHTHYGRYAQAADTLRQSLELRERAYGPDHPTAENALNNLAIALRWLGEYQTAEEIYLRVLEIYRKSYGQGQHADHAAVLNNLGGVRAAGGGYVAAESAYRESYALFSKLYGEDDRTVFFVALRIQAARIRKGEFVDAESELRALSEQWRDRLQEHWLLAFADCLMGEAAALQGRYGEAEALLRDSLRRLVELGAKDRYRREAFERLSNLLRDLGREGEIAELDAGLNGS